MIYARRGARWTILFSASNPWTGATWALDGSGRAYNTPTLGAELLTNGGMETGSPPSSWTALSATLTSVSDPVSGAAAMDVANTAAFVGGAYQQKTGQSIGQWVYLSAHQRRGSSTSALLKLTGSSLGTILGQSSTTSSSYAQQHVVGRLSETSFFAFAQNGSSVVGAAHRVDDITAKIVSLPTTLAAVTGSANNLTAAAKIHTLTTGTQAGVGALIDSASNPQNFLIAYHDGTNVKLDKCVAGTYTSLISTAVAFSSNAQIEIRRPSGNTFQLWYNGSQRGTDQTVSDAGIISNTRYGLFSTYSANLFSEFSLGGAVIPLTLPGA